MCNCGKGRRAAAAAATAPRGCVGPGCGVRVVTAPVVVVTPPPTRTRAVAVPPPVVVPTPVVVTELPIVDPVLWGPHLWRFLHIASEGCLPGVSSAGVWQTLFAAMRTGLPCPECTDHYTAWYASHPLAVSGRTGLSGPVQAWVRGLHNAVNARRGVAVWGTEAMGVYGRGGAEWKAAAREALAAAAAAGVGAWVIAAGEAVVEEGMR